MLSKQTEVEMINVCRHSGPPELVSSYCWISLFRGPNEEKVSGYIPLNFPETEKNTELKREVFVSLRIQ